MPLTRYRVHNGRVRGESSGGVQTQYLTDALGSLTATVDTDGEVINTYRHKPYGGLLAKTGAGDDPKYLWTGDTGSRATGLAYGEQYNRRRHLGTIQAGWTSVDPLWPEESAYGYVQGNPTTWTDPSGRVFIIGVPRMNNPFPGNCGFATFEVRFLLTGHETGMLVQRVCRLADKNDCQGRPIRPTRNPNHCFYEAWRVNRGQIRVQTRLGNLRGHGIDTFTIDDEGEETRGQAALEGDVRFIPMPSAPDFNMDPKWRYYDSRYPDAGQLPTRDDPPPGWSKAAYRRHFLGVRWDCCVQCDSYKGTQFMDSKTVIGGYEPRETG